MLDDSLVGLDELNLLELSSNALNDVPSALSSLPKLDYLYFSSNPLVVIGPHAFAGVNELNELFLTNMPTLLEVHPDAFQGSTLLQQLALSNNPNLTVFTAEHLPGVDHPKLRLLYLNGNGFGWLGRDLFDDKPLLQRVDIQANPLECDCKLQWMSQVCNMAELDFAAFMHTALTHTY